MSGSRVRFGMGVAAAMLAVATCSLLGPGRVSASPTVSHSATQAVSHKGLGSVPEAARGLVSSSLGRGEPAYHVAGLRARNPAQRLDASFSRDGATVVSGSAQVRFKLDGYGRVGALRAVASVAPRVTGQPCRLSARRREGVVDERAAGPRAELRVARASDGWARPVDAVAGAWAAGGCDGAACRRRGCGAGALWRHAAPLLRAARGRRSWARPALVAADRAEPGADPGG